MLIGLLAYLPFLVIAFIAQWSDRRREMRWATYGLFLLLDGLTALMGILALLISYIPEAQQVLQTQYPAAAALHWDVFGLMVIGTALLAPVFLLPFVRRGLARFTPITPSSSIQATALALVTLATGLNLSQAPLIGGLNELAESSIQITSLDIITSSLPIGLLAIIGVGFLIRRTPRETGKRLGLKRITGRQVGLTVCLTLVILTLYYGIEWGWRALEPRSYALMTKLDETLYGGVKVAWQAIAVSLVAGVTEELFFRGALQPRFGLLPTAFLFTAVHVQYGLTPATLEVFGGALALGWLRRRTSTSACILLHALYNIAGFLIFPLLP